jgi:hypothetical protein
MPLTTPCAGLPFPTDTDPIDVAGDLARLALAADSAICGIRGKHLGEITAFWDVNPASAPPKGTLRLTGGTFDGTVYPELAAYLGSTTLPDLRGSFLRGTGGAFPNNGQQGGSADTVVVDHDHGLGSHRHTIDHDHGSRSIGGGDHAHGFSGSTEGAGQHGHNVGNGEVLPYKAPWNGLGFPITGNPGNVFWWQYNDMTFLHDGWHGHSFSGGTDSRAHSHTVSVPALSGSQSGAATGNTGKAGVSGTNRNLPPFTNVTFLIQAVPTLAA